jgi:hypothetical protein
MLLVVVSLVPFACALILFVVAFDRFMGSTDTPDVTGAMREMNLPDANAAAESRPSKTFAANA